MAKSPNHFVTQSFLDASYEPASTRWLTIDTMTTPQLNALIAAAQNMSTLAPQLWTQGFDNQVGTGHTGKREMKYLIRVHDSVNQGKFAFSLAGVRDATVYIPGTDFVDLVADAMAPALKTAIEACIVTPWFNNLVLVDSIEVTRGYK